MVLFFAPGGFLLFSSVPNELPNGALCFFLAMAQSHLSFHTLANFAMINNSISNFRKKGFNITMAYQINNGMTRHISLSLDDDTWNHAKQMADERHVSMSAYFRMVMAKEWKAFEAQRREEEAAAA